MTDKIRITGTFDDNAVPMVQSLLATLTGVQTASLLRDGAEQLPQTKAEAEAEPEA